MKMVYFIPIGIFCLILGSLPLKAYPDSLKQVKERNDTLKELALTVLDTKCNTCHRIKNSFKIFALSNMDQYAKNINKQVFLVGKMPKKGAEPLTLNEKDILVKWIANITGKAPK